MQLNMNQLVVVILMVIPMLVLMVIKMLVLMVMQMMHDFICCEEAPLEPLTSTDVSPPAGTMLLGPTQALAHPSDLLVSSLTLSCKRSASFLDLFSGQGALIATAPLPKRLAPALESAARKQGYVRR